MQMISVVEENGKMIDFEFDSTPETDAMLKQLCVKECFVRCKDCIWGFENAKGTILCERTSNADCFVEMPLNGFCSEGTTDENAEWEDMETAVHCKDCKHKSVKGKTTRYHYCEIWKSAVDETDFCSRGERAE